MYYLLFIIYFFMFCWLLLKASFIKRSGLSSNAVLTLFLIKVLASIAIGWISIHYYHGSNDYWDINREGWQEYQLMWTNPSTYFTNIFHTDYANGYGGFFDSFQSYWNDLKNNLIIKMISLFDIFSRGNYYINSLFFNYIIFFGHVALYRLFISIYKGQKNAVIICCFLLPSLLYFSSGIHKDGIVFLMLALLVFNIYTILQQPSVWLKRVSMIIFSLLVLFLMRNFIVLLLLPAIMAWLIVAKAKWRPLPVFIGVYFIGGLMLFNINRFVATVHPLEIIVQKQTDFLRLPPSATAISLDTLHPTFTGFVHNMPQAFNHLLLRPYLTELPSAILFPMNLELFLCHLLIILFIFFHKKRTGESPEPFIYFAVFFTLTAFLFIGYIVPNLGSLVRYRSLYSPFLITPLVCRINWEKIRSLLKL